MANPNQVTKDFTLARTSLIMGAYAIAQKLRQGEPLVLVREPTSKIHANDVMVVVTRPGGNRKIGYLPLGLADEIAPIMDRGLKVIARKAPNVLYGVCQLAYIKPDEEPTPAPAPAPAPTDRTLDLEPPPEAVASGEFKRDVEIVPVDNSKVLAAPFDVPVGELAVPEGVDLDSGEPVQSDLAPTDLQRDLQRDLPEVVSEVTEVQVGLSDPDTGVNIPASITVKHTLPEGVTQADIDAATDLPPLGDSRRPAQEVPDDEQGPTGDRPA